MKGYAPKLRSELGLGPLKMNPLILIMKLVVVSENLGIRVTSAWSDSPNKLTNLNNSIRSELMKLHLKLVKDAQEHGVRRYAKASNKEILEHNRLVLPKSRNRFYAWWLDIPLGEQARGAFEI
jgi:hypothetical protein